ncbi:MAG: ribosome silencing factor [Tepidisphaeraceae bacterium]|jgi:ribosome-associated protein
MKQPAEPEKQGIGLEGQAARLDSSRKFAVELAQLAHHTRCHNIIILDMAGVSPVTDFYVIATGTSARQMKTVCDQVDELAKKSGFKSFHRSGYEGDTWIAVDYIDVVLHIFSTDARVYYDLENLWGDAKRLEWNATA